LNNPKNLPFLGSSSKGGNGGNGSKGGIGPICLGIGPLGIGGGKGFLWPPIGPRGCIIGAGGSNGGNSLNSEGNGDVTDCPNGGKLSLKDGISGSLGLGLYSCLGFSILRSFS